jgi:hypothetical protein
MVGTKVNETADDAVLENLAFPENSHCCINRTNAHGSPHNMYWATNMMSRRPRLGMYKCWSISSMVCLVGLVYNASQVILLSRFRAALLQVGTRISSTHPPPPPSRINLNLLVENRRIPPRFSKPPTVVPPPTNTTTTMVVDILSIGSRTRLDYLQTQQETFASHVTVRSFFNVTEEDDVDRWCERTVSESDIARMVQFCRSRSSSSMSAIQSSLTRYFAPSTILQRKSNPVGWLCAQTRPAIGLHKVLQHYSQTRKQALPDYLILVDDDTYFNLEVFRQHMVQQGGHPSTAADSESSSVPAALAGCLVPFRHFSFPHGGFGWILNQALIQSLMLPIPCDGDSCAVLNHLGEERLFRPGMTVADLIYAYATDQPFSNYSHWTASGFCVHGDWYVLQYYYMISLCILGWIVILKVPTLTCLLVHHLMLELP